MFRSDLANRCFCRFRLGRWGTPILFQQLLGAVELRGGLELLNCSIPLLLKPVQLGLNI